MNKQFEHLMYESGLTAYGSWNHMDSYDQEAVAVFAKLVVKECARVVATAVEQREPASGYVDKIKERFGL